MTFDEIKERFILAAETERKMPKVGEKPAQPKSVALPFIREEDPKDEEPAQRVASAAEVTAWEECRTWTNVLVPDAKNRRALWAWASAKAGGKPLKHWCDREGINVETGRRRKDRAISFIERGLDSNVLQKNENVHFAVLLDNPDLGHIPDTVSNVAQNTKQSNSWMDETCFSPVGVLQDRDFTWAEARNKRRSQRREQKAKAQGEQIAR
ncbi:hypothetical protein IFT84_17535 [Rhizobium sp. CFBP 8762]|uniref:hypothetical protein n=1 Tax=Rhizobium sp. CFBP 8762 TaxID=2775279 RepID=UPI001786D0E8|nr:hypothetical protein [Rhizobium sp. CFBP 8762]MBD8556313.1 hypothetical protein [Rhizobium sp. CFBP 8762]